MGDFSPRPDIAPNSRYDQSITFDDDENSEPGAYSPRPDANERAPDLSQFQSLGRGPSRGGGLADFELNLGNQAKSLVSGFGNPGYNPGFAPLDNSAQPNRLGLGGGGFGDFSPRPRADSHASPALSTSPELAQLFSLISKFQPQPFEMAPHYKPFVPDLVPSIGTIDAFIKVPRPDGEEEQLGLTLLDEPTIGCSNPQILRMQLREKFGVVGGNDGDGYIGSIDHPERNHKALTSFLESYDEISRTRAAPKMTYTYKMPDLEQLMQIWPGEMDEALSSVPLPTADMDLSLEEYTKVICALLDIPVNGNLVESLHVLFSLFQMFKDIGYMPGGSRGETPN
jgi:intraflagellar transport protein 46